jgi:hypothetical protein
MSSAGGCACACAYEICSASSCALCQLSVMLYGCERANQYRSFGNARLKREPSQVRNSCNPPVVDKVCHVSVFVGGRKWLCDVQCLLPGMHTVCMHSISDHYMVLGVQLYSSTQRIQRQIIRQTSTVEYICCSTCTGRSGGETHLRHIQSGPY